MPSKSAQLIAFFVIFALSAASHRFVYVHVKQLILRDFGRRAEKVRRIVAMVFLIMDLPFVYLYLSKWIAGGHDALTRAFLYPFSLWQALMLFWTAILLVRLFLKRTAHAGVSVVRYARSARSSTTEDALEAEPTL